MSVPTQTRQKRQSHRSRQPRQSTHQHQSHTFEVVSKGRRAQLEPRAHPVQVLEPYGGLPS